MLRGRSYWTPAEREYFAVFTLRLNECPFCVLIHAETSAPSSRRSPSSGETCSQPVEMVDNRVCRLPFLEHDSPEEQHRDRQFR
jgi:hypothetical protein